MRTKIIVMTGMLIASSVAFAATPQQTGVSCPQNVQEAEAGNWQLTRQIPVAPNNHSDNSLNKNALSMGGMLYCKYKTLDSPVGFTWLTKSS